MNSRTHYTPTSQWFDGRSKVATREGHSCGQIGAMAFELPIGFDHVSDGCVGFVGRLVAIDQQ